MAASSLISTSSTGSLTTGLAAAAISPDPSNGNVATESMEASINQPESSCDENDFILDKQGTSYILPKCSIPPSEEMKPVEKFVAKSVRQRLDSTAEEAKGYRLLIRAIKQKDDPSMLYKIFLSMRTAGDGSTLHHLSGNPSKHAELMHVLLRFNPFQPPAAFAEATPKKKKVNENSEEKRELERPFHDYSLADAYFHLVLAFVSANSVFLVPSMTTIWKLLTFYTGDKDPPLARTQRLHATLAEMIRLCPTANREIFPIITINFPFRTKPQNELVWCYRQAFAVVEYVPSIYSQLLHFVIDKCLEMDVEIKIQDTGEVAIEDEGEADQGADHSEEGMFDMELDEGKEKKKLEKLDSLVVNEMADKLDAVMLLTFQFFEKEARHNVFESRKLYERCYPAFESSILIAYRSKFVQFILFFLCGLENEALFFQNLDGKLTQQHATLYREFVAKLLDLVMDPYRPSNVKQCAACYLASFISRARYVEAGTICECLCALLRWADTYVAALPSFSISASDARNQTELHPLFYTICQAAFYVMCFRGAEAVQFYREVEQRELKGPSDQMAPLVGCSLYDVDLQQVDISSARWIKICGHQLRPLRFCLETVRSEFLFIARDLGLLDAKMIQRLSNESNGGSMWQRKKKTSLIATPATLEVARHNGGVGGLGRGSNPLDSFFPFDPYLLRRSHEYIEPFYKQWGDEVALDNDSVEYVQREDEEVDEEEDEDAKSQSSDLSEVDDSLNSNDENDFRESYEDPAMILSTPTKSVGALSAPREAWTETLKRSRAPSIESSGAGSW